MLERLLHQSNQCQSGVHCLIWRGTMCRWCCRRRICWHRWGLLRDHLGIHLVDLNGDSIWYCLVKLEACPRRFWRERCKWNHVVSGFEEFQCEFQEDGFCCYPVSNGEIRVAWRQYMEDASVGLEQFLGCEVAQNRGVGVKRHCDGERSWAEESGKINGSVRKPSTLSPKYQGNNLYMLVINIFYKGEKILYFLQF